jgi:hypothetical protein
VTVAICVALLCATTACDSKTETREAHVPIEGENTDTGAETVERHQTSTDVSEVPEGFEPGPALEPPGPLLSWLEDREGATVRLPVTIELRREGLRAVDSAYLGDSERGISLDLDDTTMGVALTTQLAEICPDARRRCRVWLVGSWGPPLAGGPRLAPPGDAGLDDDGSHPFTVRSVEGEIADSDSALRVYVRAQTP